MSDPILIEIQGPYTDWCTPEATTGYVNRVGGSCAAVKADLSSSTPPVPGVIRFTCTGSADTNHVWAKTISQSTDIKHPGIGTVNLPKHPDSSTWYSVLPGISIKMGTSPAIGDQFDVWHGYERDTLSGLYLPVTAFGIVYPATPGLVIGVRVTNTDSTRFLVNTTFEWTIGSRPVDLISGRLAGDMVWTPGAGGWIYLQDAAAINGVILPGGQAVVQLQPYPPSDIDASSNLNVIIGRVGYAVC